MSNVKTINLKFTTLLSNLAGYSYGKATYRELVKDNINLQEKTIIKFPDHIEQIASSFVQGFFLNLLKELV